MWLFAPVLTNLSIFFLFFFLIYIFFTELYGVSYLMISPQCED